MLLFLFPAVTELPAVANLTADGVSAISVCWKSGYGWFSCCCGGPVAGAPVVADFLPVAGILVVAGFPVVAGVPVVIGFLAVA